MTSPCDTLLITPQGIPGASGIVGDLAWNTGAALLTASENLGGFAISKPFTASAQASVARCLTPATADKTFAIYSATVAANVLTAVQIGSVSFAAGQYVGAVTFLDGLNLIAQGALIYLVAPGTPDATLALVSVTVASL